MHSLIDDGTKLLPTLQLTVTGYSVGMGTRLIDLSVSCNLKEEIVMEIVSKTEGSKVTMEITGWLDTQTAPQLEKELSALDPGTTSLVFDFANLEYISSAGLRLVIAAYKKMAGKGRLQDCKCF